MTDMTSLSFKDQNAIASHQVAPSPQQEMEAKELRPAIFQLLDELDKRVKKENEKICVAAIRTVFENVDNLDFLNKRAIYVYVREISGLTSKQLSVAMSRIRKHYREIVHDSRLIDLF